MSILNFIGTPVICAGIFYGYYYAFLRNKDFHQYNRFYLLAVVCLSLVLPFITLPVLHLTGRPVNGLISNLQVISAHGWEEAFVGTASENSVFPLLTITNGLWAVYGAGVVWFGYSLIKSLLHLRAISLRYPPENQDNVIIYDTREEGAPFSFFHRIYWNQDISRDSEKGRQIMLHERYHVLAGHSYDIIFLEIVGVVCWFNPFIHLVIREVKAIHEFLADDFASRHAGPEVYAEMLVVEALAGKQVTLTNPFFQNQIKRRISMMFKSDPTSFTNLRRIMALPLVVGVCCAFAVKPDPTSAALLAGRLAPVTVIIDAGHGGVDAGVLGPNGTAEKDLTLAIAKMIRDKSSAYGIAVTLTRDADLLPGNASNASDGLRNRTAMAEQGNAALFVSIHINQKSNAPQPAGPNGFDIYVSQQNRQFDKSRLLASAISGEIKKSYPITDALRESNSIWVLKSSPIPAVLIECGYMDDERELAYISDPKNQAILAENILQGISRYASNLSSATPTKASQGQPSPSQESDREASYPGGPQGWMRFLNSRFRYPPEAVKNSIEGTVVVEFLVDEKGKVSKIKAIEGPELGGLREETIRMIRESGKWLPAMKDNQPVASLKKQPITFRMR